MEAGDWEEFERVFEELLRGQSAESRSTFAFVKRTIWQSNLGGRYETSDILTEVYIRAKFSQKINKPIPWIRSTAFNYCRELSRGEKRERLLTQKAIDESKQELVSSPIEEISEEKREANLNKIKEAWAYLSSEEREILRVQIIEALSWKEIQARFSISGKEVPTVEALRKRGSRARKKLRELFHGILQDVT